VRITCSKTLRATRVMFLFLLFFIGTRARPERAGYTRIVSLEAREPRSRVCPETLYFPPTINLPLNLERVLH